MTLALQRARLCPLLAFVLLARAATLADVAPPSRLLLGVLVKGREVGALEVLRVADGYLLPLEELCDSLHIDRVRRGRGYRLTTPLGPLGLDEADLTVVDGVPYVHTSVAERKLAVLVRFDERQFALHVDPPWGSRPDPSGPPVSAELRRPDIAAPDSTLSGLSGNLTHTTVGGNSTLSGAARLQGRIYDGLWKVRFEDAGTRPFQVREYEWSTRVDRASYLVGRQRLQLHPGLAGFDMAGFQMAWSNRLPEDEVSLFTAEGSILSQSARPVETFRGEATPGSFVQLRVENRVVATQQVGYDGHYEFLEVPLPSRRLSEVEVLIFDRHNRQVPIETRRYRLAASRLLLPAGAVLHTFGFGATGNFTEGFFGGTPGAERSSGGFYQWRQGINSMLTAETAVQYAAADVQSYAGFVARLSETWVANMGVSWTPGAMGHTLALEGFRPKTRIFAQSSSIPAEFQPLGEAHDRHDHVVELYRDLLPRLTVGVTARLRDDGFVESRFALPSLSWRPTGELYFDVRPDVYGDYIGNASWAFRPDTRARLFHSHVTDIELSHDLNDRYRVDLVSSFGGGLPTRHTASVIRRALALEGWSFRGGLLATEGELGYLAGASTPILPGFQVQVEYQSIPYRSFVGEEKMGRLLLSVSTDLSHVGGSFLPSHAARNHRTRGSIGGRVRLEERYREAAREAGLLGGLGGVAVMVDGRVRARTDGAGRFLVPDVASGNHVVEMDPEHLPIELDVDRGEYVVEVRPGSATRVDFEVHLEYGLAGRVIDAEGRPVAGEVVDLVDARGTRVGRTRTDAFGLYRLDGIRPGRYRARVVEDREGDVRVMGERIVEVRDFSFGQDLELSDPGRREVDDTLSEPPP